MKSEINKNFAKSDLNISAPTVPNLFNAKICLAIDAINKRYKKLVRGYIKPK